MRTIVSLMLLIFLSTLTLYSQVPVISLSGYTYKESNPQIGFVCLRPDLGEIQSVSISGRDAKHLKLINNTLSTSIPTAADRKEMEIVVEVRAANAVYRQSFKLLRDEFIRNKVIAHRGAWKNSGVAENSIASLQHAIQLGCEASEFDVHMSADSVPVINHDPVIQGLPIEKSQSADLLKLKLAGVEPMPTLESYLRKGISQNRTRLVLEIKPSVISNERGIATTRKVLELVSRLKAQAWIDYISFDFEICKEILRLDPNAHVAYLNGDKNPQELKAASLWGFDYHYNVLKKNESWLQTARDTGLTTNAWTVNDPESMLWFLDKNIDYITTNEPELLLELVNQL